MRDLALLKEPFLSKVKDFLAELDRIGFEYLISETLRTKAVQEAYFAQGRKPLEEVNKLRVSAGLWEISEKENKTKITWTLKSKHLEGLAIDIVPSKDGKFWWNAPDEKWKQMRDISEQFDIESGYTWKNKDIPHFEERIKQ